MNAENLITVQGIVDEIKRDATFKDGQGNEKRTIEFIVTREVGGKQHYYVLKAISKGKIDQFGIGDLISQEISAECYLNGRKTHTDKGPWFSNDLVVRKLQTV